MRALELTAKGEAGFDNAMGFRYLQAILDPTPGKKFVNGNEITVRPLALMRLPGAVPDVVENMFLIEPKDTTVGPHILYRPLNSSAPLLQFPSRQALMESVQTQKELQKDILAWLPDETTRAVYRHDGFREPHMPTYTPVFTPAPPTLATHDLSSELQTGQLMSYLYEANSRALTSLAKHQAVSNGESRWERIKEGAGLLLNTAFLFMPESAFLIGMPFQADSIISDIKTLTGSREGNKEAAATDLFINIAMLMLHLARAHPTQTSSRTGVAAIHTVPQETRVGDLPAAPSPESALREVIRLGGPWRGFKAIDGDIQTFEDIYKGAPRLNIFGHGTEPAIGEPAKVVGANGKFYSAQDIVNKLRAEKIDFSKYKNIVLRVCYSGANGPNSLGDEISNLTNIPTKSFAGPVHMDYFLGKDPIGLFKTYYREFKAKYPTLSPRDIKLLADSKVRLDFAKNNHLNTVEKTSGTLLRFNIGTQKEPEMVQELVDYRPHYSYPALHAAHVLPANSTR